MRITINEFRADMRTIYKVNGKNASLGEYMNASDNNDYLDTLQRKAEKYYRKHPEEWEKIKNGGLNIDPESWIVLNYESTEEGNNFGKIGMLIKKRGCTKPLEVY